MKRILITGSREWTDTEAMGEELLWFGFGLVVHGAARGADKLADALARGFGWPTEPHPVTRAEWNRIGKRAGHLRNQRMVDLGADICLAFPTVDSRGTWDCAARARRAGIPVVFVLGPGLTDADIEPRMRAAEERL